MTVFHFRNESDSITFVEEIQNVVRFTKNSIETKNLSGYMSKYYLTDENEYFTDQSDGSVPTYEKHNKLDINRIFSIIEGEIE